MYCFSGINGEPMSSDNLKSEKDVDYSKLQMLLREGRWEEADYETYIVMLEVVDRREGDWIRPDEMKSFPSGHLIIINNLWTKHSNGKFGFSIQKKIYESIRNSFQDINEYPQTESPTMQQPQLFANESVEFVKRVGWQVDRYKDLTFDIKKAPDGHLPGCWAFRFFGFGWYLLSRKEI